MKYNRLGVREAALAAALLAMLAAVFETSAAPPSPPWLNWTTAVNNNDPMPGDPAGRTFNSYNQPSVNVDGLVVIRARSRGGSGTQPAHGIYTRDMLFGDIPTNPIVRILDRSTLVPETNNLGATFIETPSFPRIDMWSNTIATRGNHPPVWQYELGIDPDTGEAIETRAGTTGIYTNPFGDLITGVAKLGVVPDFEFLSVPGLEPGTTFEVFPGAPSVTDGDVIVFKGNFTVDGAENTGVFYRELSDDPIVLLDGTLLAPAGGISPAVLIANSVDTLIPGTDQIFGSTAPPSAAARMVVFSGFDNEDAPTLGGIYLAPLAERPQLKPLVTIGQRVPAEPPRNTFRTFGEGNAFDGRNVGFWGAWGTATRTVRLYCPTEGNRDRIAYCNQNLVCADTGEVVGDPDSVCDETGCYQDKPVPINQGIFVHDTANGSTRTVTKTGPGPGQFTDFLFWTYSGRTPCVGSGGHGEEGAEEDGEAARWRSSAFVAVSGRQAAFKAAAHDVVGIYFNRGPGRQVTTVLDTRTDGQSVDPEAPPGSTVTEVGLEREGLRGDWLVLTAAMGVEGGTEEEGMAGVYITRLP